MKLQRMIFQYILPVCLVLLLAGTVFSAVWSRPRSYTAFLGEAENNVEKIVVQNLSVGRELTLTTAEEFRAAHAAFAGDGRDAVYYCYHTDWSFEHQMGNSGYRVTYYRTDGKTQSYHIRDGSIQTVPIQWELGVFPLNVTNDYYAPQSDYSFFEQLDWENAPVMSLSE